MRRLVASAALVNVELALEDARLLRRLLALIRHTHIHTHTHTHNTHTHTHRLDLSRGGVGWHVRRSDLATLLRHDDGSGVTAAASCGALAARSLALDSALWRHWRHCAKAELAVLAHDVLLRLLAAPPRAVSADARIAVLSELATWADSSQIPELFLNFDMGASNFTPQRRWFRSFCSFGSRSRSLWRRAGVRHAMVCDAKTAAVCAFACFTCAGRRDEGCHPATRLVWSMMTCDVPDGSRVGQAERPYLVKRNSHTW